VQIGPDIYPDHHFLLIAPNLGSEWFFDAARKYWERYRPTVVSSTRFIGLVPPDKTVTVTVVARRDIEPDIARQMIVTAPNAYYDPVVFEAFDDAKAELNRRAEQGQPFGMPLSVPTPTYDPNMPVVIPTATHPPGFITQTPDPALLTPESTRQQLNPTPGPITGG